MNVRALGAAGATRRAAWVLAACALSACAATDTAATGPAAVAKAERPPASAEVARVDENGASATGASAARCEHGVLPAVCPKCNPRLAAVFQAKGDWCGEHGFPESFCPLCRPERGGAPAVEVASDGAPADGTKVRLKTPEDARVAGIATVPAVARPGGARLSATGTLAFDANRRAEVNVRVPGILRSVLVDVGTSVRAGDPLAVVESAAVSADLGRRGAAEVRLRLAEATLERETRLFESGATSNQDLLTARGEVEAARAELAAVQSALGFAGSTGRPGGRTTLTSPLEGTVLRRHATLGRLVGPEDVLFEIADTRTLWAEIDLPERQAGRVQVGQRVTLTVEGAETPAIEGHIHFVAPEIDPQTRTVRARATIANADGRLRAHMFARAEIALGDAAGSVLVPRAAVQQAKGVHFVFVRTGPQDFEARRVKLGAAPSDPGNASDPSNDTRELLSGVRAGEDVVTEGSFLLKTETLKGSIGAGCCDE